MKAMEKVLCLALVLCLICGLAAGASASIFTDAHGNSVEHELILGAGAYDVSAGPPARKGAGS